MKEKGMWYWNRPAGACVRVTGDDAFEYLQSQMSQDLRPLKNGGVAYGLWLDKKGKVQADSFVLRAGEGYYLVAPGFSADDLIEWASKNVIADDVEFVADATATTCLTVFGDSAVGAVAALLADMGSSEIDRNGAAVDLARVAPVSGVAAVYPGLVEGSINLVLSAECHKSAAEALLGMGCREDDGSAYLQARVMSGVLELPTEVGANDLPQEVGLERFAVSYTKGCYFGQEVMARLRAMGRPRNGLARVRFEVGVGDDLPVDLEMDDAKIGEIRVVAGHTGLAVVSRRRVDDPYAVVHTADTKRKVAMDGWFQ